MDSKSEDMFLQNIEEFVFDEEKIVTYKWLSRVLNIHVNLSKQLLYTFCSKDARQDSVCATYLLAGQLRSTGEDHISVVGQDKYEEAKSLFDSLTSEHVYSVQKSKKTPSQSTLYTVDSQPVEEKDEGPSSLGAIQCSESVRRAAEEISLLRITVAPVQSAGVAAKSAKPAPTINKVSPTKPKTDDKDVKGEHVPKDGKAKGGLAAMFAAQASKTSTKTAASTSSAKSCSKNKTGGISNFFSKVDKQINAKETLTEEKEEVMDSDKGVLETNKSKSEIKKPDIDSNKPAEKPEAETKKPPPVINNKSTKNSKKNNKRVRESSKKQEPKKRRRIVVPDLDSSDDDIFAEDGISSREPTPEPESPVLEAKVLESDEEEDVIPPTPVNKDNENGRVRRRRKVTKDKTFMDDDGYVVTEKVTEYESYSESDSETNEVKKMKEPEVKGNTVQASTSSNNKKTSTSKSSKGQKSSPAKAKSPSKTNQPTKNKQQSLMSFFKKKD